MDVAELGRISTALSAAIADASAIASDLGICNEFREAVQHAREMRDIFAEALIASEPLATDELRKIEEWAERAVAQLESLAVMRDGMMQ